MRASKAIQKSGIKTQNDAANLMMVNAKRLAPHDTGELIQGIQKRSTKNGVRVISTVPGSFKQNLWTNQKAPFRRPRMYWNDYEPTVYGDGTHQNTGTPRWFDRAAQIVQKKYPSFAVRNTKDALKTAIR